MHLVQESNILVSGAYSCFYSWAVIGYPVVYILSSQLVSSENCAEFFVNSFSIHKVLLKVS